MSTTEFDADALRCSLNEAINIVENFGGGLPAEHSAAAPLAEILADLRVTEGSQKGWRGRAAKALNGAGWKVFAQQDAAKIRVEIFDAAVRISPRNTDSWRGLAICHEAQCDDAAALEAAEIVLQLSPGDSAALLTSASTALAVGRFDLAVARCDEALLVDPDSGSAHRIRAWLAAFLDDWQVAVEHFSSAVAIDADDTQARWGRATNLPRVGRPGDALGDLSFLAALPGPSSVDDSQHRLKIQSQWVLGRGDETLDFMEQLIAQPAQTTVDAIGLLRKYLEATNQVPRLVEFAAETVSQAGDLSALTIGLRLALAEIFVLADSHSRVELLLDSVAADLPSPVAPHSVALSATVSESYSLLRSWLSASNGRLDEAQRLYEQAVYPATRRNYRALSRCHLDDLREVRGPRPGVIGPRDVVAFTRVRNERERLVPFLDHYRALGVRWFFFVDNGSDDGTVEFLLRHRDVFVFSADEHFRETDGGLTWTQHLANTFAMGNWTLHVDADELLMFPHHIDAGLDGLTAYMESRGFAYLAAPMLLMHLDPGVLDSAVDMRIRYSLFDPDVELIGCLEAPYVDATSASGLFAVDPLEIATPELMKIPLVRQSAEHHHVNLHRVRPGPVCDATGVLLHFKLATDLPSRSTYAYASKLWNSMLVVPQEDPDSRLHKLSGFEQLVDAGIVRTSELFDKFVNDKAS